MLASTRGSAPDLTVLVAEPSEGYALLDSGEGEKLERFGDLIVTRPEPQAMWGKSVPDRWAEALARFEGDEEEGRGKWSAAREADVSMLGATLRVRTGGNHHVGLFPEQAPHWAFARDAMAGGGDLLNLFGYTGAASLILAAAGADVTHLDASKKAIAWGRENQAASGLDTAPIRWICDDARKFAAREVRRGRTYRGILLDPPKFGRGPKNEVWNLFDDLGPLLNDVAALTARENAFVLLTAYAIRASALSMARVMADAMPKGRISAGELALREEASGRLLPTSMFALWQSP